VSVDPLPDIRDKSDRFQLARLVAVGQIIGLNLRVQDRNGLGEELFPKSSQQMGEDSPMNPEDDKTDVTQDELLDAGLRATLRRRNQTTLFHK